MRRTAWLSLTVVLLLCGTLTNVRAAGTGGEDTDLRLVGARVVEVTEHHLSVVARTGVEHVIALDGNTTQVQRGEQYVSIKDLCVGDVITVELDELKPVKFAKVIAVTQPAATEVARAPEL